MDELSWVSQVGWVVLGGLSWVGWVGRVQISDISYIINYEPYNTALISI